MQGQDLSILPAGGELLLHEGQGDDVVEGLGYGWACELYSIIIKLISSSASTI